MAADTASVELYAGRMQIEFVVGDLLHPSTVTPLLDGVSLADLIEQFESTKAMEPAGGYAGIVAWYFNFGSLEEYFLGKSTVEYWRDLGKVALLGCKCGEVGCWPLHASVTVGDGRVAWSGFEQPYRPERDYSEFGPFNFDLGTYRAALELGEASLNQ